MEKVIHDNSQAVKIRNLNEEKEKQKYTLVTHKNYGKVPHYIDKFNKQRENQIIQRMIEEEKQRIPPGTRLMPEEERL